MERISNNYAMYEFERSETAALKGIKNTIPESVKPALRALVVNLLQPINDATGWRNRISSGYRCNRLNEAVGGTWSSQHKTGEASDNNFYIPDALGRVVRHLAPVEVAEQVISQGLEFDQMILYPTFVHLSHTTRRKNRKQILYSKTYRGPKIQ